MCREGRRKSETPPPNSSQTSFVSPPSPPPPPPRSPSAVSMMTSSHRSYFISQINLQNSTEILCVLIAPVKTSEKLPSAGAVDAARLGDALPGLGTRGRPGRCLPPAQPGLVPGGLSAVCFSVGDPSDLPQNESPSPPLTREQQGGGLRHRTPGSPSPAPRAPLSPGEAAVPGRARRQCCRAQGPSAPAPPPDTHGLRGLPWGTTPRGRCRPPAWRGSLPGSGAPRTRGVQERERRSHPLRSSAARRVGVEPSLGGDRPPPPLRSRTRSRARRRAQLGRPRAPPPRRSSPWAFWAGGPGRPPRPRGYLRTPPSPRPARSATPRPPPGHRARGRGALEKSSSARSAGPARPRPPAPPGASPPALDSLISRGGQWGPEGAVRGAPSEGPREGVLAGGGARERGHCTGRLRGWPGFRVSGEYSAPSPGRRNPNSSL